MVSFSRWPSILRKFERSVWHAKQTNQANDRTRQHRASRSKYRTSKPKLREANLNDYEQIAAIQIRNGLASRPRENWLAFWQDNPVYKQYEGRWTIGWLLENEQGVIVGWLGNVPSIYHFRGKELVCATMSPWAVDQPYRDYSNLLLDRFSRQKDVDLFLITTAGAAVGPVSRLFGFSKVPVGTWNRAAFWITNYRGFLQIALSMKAFPLARCASYPLAAALFFRDWFKVDHLYVDAAAPEIELCSTFDRRFDAFWEELKQQRNDVLLGVRSRETLLWHFRDTLARRRLWIFAFRERSRILAYAVLDRHQNAFGLRRVRLVDFQALPGCERTITALLSKAIYRAAREGMHLLEITGCWLERPDLTQIIPPHRRKLPSWIFYYKPANRELRKILQASVVWAPSSFDGDAALIKMMLV